MEAKQTYQLDFTESEFTYNISYDPISEGIRIEAVHNAEFLSWSKIISSDLEDITSSGIKYTFTTSILFKIFEMYVKKDLPELTTIKLPTGYKADNIPLMIEIATCSPYNPSDKDIKFISLDPVKVESEKRFKLKLEQRDQKIDNLHDDIDELRSMIEELFDKFNKITNDYYTKEEIQKMKFAKTETIYTKSEIDKLLVKNDYYTKEESDNKYTRKGASYTIAQSDARYVQIKNVIK